jgi:DNA-binding beta-propeller fold protein YncE
MMRTVIILASVGIALSLLGQQPKSKDPAQGYVPEAWYPHQGSLLKYRVNVRFGIDTPGGRDDSNALPAGQVLGRVSAVTTDSKGEVYVFQRGKKADPVIVYSADGKYLRSWGRDLIRYPHGIRADKDDNIWCIDRDNHQVYKFTRDGKLLMTLGIKGKAGTDEQTFNRPTDIAWAPTGGDFYISDGYGNSRVVKFNRDGKY